MQTFGIDRRNIGLNFTSEGFADFLLWSPFAKSVELIVNDKQFFSAEKEEYGYWSYTTKEIKPGDTYQIKINTRKILSDPASLSQPEGVHDASRAIDLNAFKWDDEDWKGIDTSNQLIFYEIHTGTFTHKGNFLGVVEQIDYLKQLGVNVIELMPVAQFPGSRNWGYDGVYPFAVQNSYGGANGLQKLVNAFHKNGIAVVLDVVYNHLGPEGNYLNEFGPYFTDKYKTPWGKALNFDDEWCDGVRRYYIENMLMWLRDFHFDGLRLDAVHAIKDLGAKHIIQELKENADKLSAITKKKYFLIGEIDLNDVRFINSPQEGGYGLDMQWCDEFHHSVHSLVTGEHNGYYSDFGELWQLEKSFNSAYVYDGIYSPHRKKKFGSSTSGKPGNKFVVFIQNHDQVGNRMLGERLSGLVDFEVLKLAAGAMFVSPFVPFIFMGEEYAESNPFQYFTSHTDEELVKLVRKGRMEEFKDFMNAANIPDPQSTETFKNSILKWDNLHSKKNLIFDFYKELIRLKKFHPVLKSFDRSGTHARIINDKAIQLLRKTDNHILLAVMNFSDGEMKYDLSLISKISLVILLDSSEEKWGGPNKKSEISNEREITVNPHSIVMLSDILG